MRNKYAINFQVISLLDVFEHIEDPVSLLNKIHLLLNPDGVLCIVTPDFGSFTANILSKKWWGIRLAHISYFRMRDLERLFLKTKFRIIRKKTYVRYFSLYYILFLIRKISNLIFAILTLFFSNKINSIPIIIF